MVYNEKPTKTVANEPPFDTFLTNLVHRLSELKGVEMEDLTPLSESLDLDAAEKLLETGGPSFNLKFETNGWSVTAYAHDAIFFERIEQ